MCNTSKVTSNHAIVEQAQIFDTTSAGEVLIAIAFHATKPKEKGEGWRSYPSRATIAKLTGMVERTVLTCTDRLVEAGLIKIIKSGKKGVANIYELNLNLIFNPTKEVFRILTGRAPSNATTELVKRSAEQSKINISKFLEKIGIKKKTCPQPTQNPIRENGSSSTITSDPTDPTNNKDFKDLKREQRASAIPSLEKPVSEKQNMPSKRAVEMILACSKSCIQKISSEFKAMLNLNAPDSEIEPLRNELLRHQQTIENHRIYAECYGIAL